MLIFALASALRLARFNAAVDEEKPRWQSNFFVGMPTPAAAIAVLLPVYLSHVGFDIQGSRVLMSIVMLYTIAVAFMMVSTIPTYSGKLLGERIGREWVLPIFILAMAYVAHLLTFPFETLSLSTLAYLASILVSWRFYRRKEREGLQAGEAAGNPAAAAPVVDTTGRVVGLRPGDTKRPGAT